MRCDFEEKLVQIIDHFRSNAHQVAVDASKVKELWEKQSLRSHPWLRILEKQDKLTVENLMSLAAAYAEQQTSYLKENERNGCPFIQFAPTSLDLHCKDPLVNKEILTIIAELKLRNLKLN